MSDVTPPPAAAPYAAAPTGPKTNTLAIVSLVLALAYSSPMGMPLPFQTLHTTISNVIYQSVRCYLVKNLA